MSEDDRGDRMMSQEPLGDARGGQHYRGVGRDRGMPEELLGEGEWAAAPRRQWDVKEKERVSKNRQMGSARPIIPKSAH